MPQLGLGGGRRSWTEACGKERCWERRNHWSKTFRQISDAKLWQFRAVQSKSIIEYARERLSRQLAASGATPKAVTRRNTYLIPGL